MHLNELNFLDVTNDGLVLGNMPNGNRIKFLEYIVEESKRRVDEHGDTPTQTDPERHCTELKHSDEPSWLVILLSLKFFTSLTIFSIICAVLIKFTWKKCRDKTSLAQ